MAARSYLPVAVAAVTATLVRGPLLGTEPLFGGAHVPARGHRRAAHRS
jgi:chloride channel protein, CIC family